MKKHHIKILLTQKFNEVIPSIPTNSLFYKNVTNIGATFGEIMDDTRDSIIIEPNTPVIIGKEKQHKNVIAVYSKVTLEDIHTRIVKILKSGKRIKIMCTPESYNKAVRGLKLAGLDVYNDVFCLFDECEKLAKDVHYRQDIIMPLDYFFKFKNKAFISATAMEPSDPRFNIFERYYIIPQESIAIPIKIFPTNNTLFSLEQLLKAYTERAFIFFNSVYSIAGFISTLKLDEDDVSIFASTKAVERLKLLDYKNVYDKIDEKKFTKYNFFTCRYFSAVDIYVDYDVNIYMVTDVLLASFTAIDPKTDAVQIHGRFRNKQYKRNLFAIFSTDKDIDVLTDNELQLQEKLILEIHRIIQTYKLTLSNDKSVNELENMFKSYPFGKFIDGKGNINHYMRDNTLYLNSVKMLYTDKELVLNAYRQATAEETSLPYFSIETIKEHSHFISMDNMSMVSSKYSFASFITNYTNALDSIEANLADNPNDENLLEQKNDLKVNFPDIYNCYEYERNNNLNILRSCKSKKDILFLNHEYGLRRLSSNNALIDRLKIEFPIGEFVPEDKLADRFEGVLDDKKSLLSPNKANLERFLKLSNRTTRNKKKGYIIRDYVV